MKKIIATAALTTALAFGNSAANAAPQTSVVRALGGVATVTADSGSHTVSAIITDTARDRRCVSLYTRGYNIFLGWRAWTYKTQACDGLVINMERDRVVIYADHQEVKICTATCGLPLRLW
jgi:hypothetical protein